MRRERRTDIVALDLPAGLSERLRSGGPEAEGIHDLAVATLETLADTMVKARVGDLDSAGRVAGISWVNQDWTISDKVSDLERATVHRSDLERALRLLEEHPGSFVAVGRLTFDEDIEDL